METGVGINNPLFFIGVVENNVDERLEGRIQVRAFGVHGTNKQVPTESLPWATLIHGSYDPNAPLPPVNSFVFGFFIDGRDAQQPMILGLIPTQMTELLDPELSGWGAIPSRDAGVLARGSTPQDFGQPANSRLARGEYVEETYVLQQEMNRIRAVEAAVGLDEERETFEEPAPTYNAEYPYNRVIETASHVFELDDTPGSERVMLYHKRNGSYVTIDSVGTTVHKSTNDKYEINDVHQHVYVGGKSHVTIIGDSRVYVKGNKVEEIEGDYTQIIHGNHIMGVGGQANINASEEVQIRAAKLRLNANVEGININAAKKLRLQSGELTSIKSAQEIRLDAEDAIGLKSMTGINASAEGAININAQDGNLNMQSSDEVNLRSSTMYLNADGALDLKGGHVKAGGGTKVSIEASLVAIDDIVQLANGQATTPQGAGDAGTAEAGEAAETADLPEPPAKSASSTGHRNNGSAGGGGYVSPDDVDPGSTSSTTSVPAYTGNRLTNAEVDSILGGEEPAQARAAAEEFLGRPLSDTEWNNLVAATVAESLPNSPEEQAAVMAVILNRVRSDQYPNTVTDVLLQRNQFQAVTGTSANGNAPSSNFTNPSRGQMASTVRGVNQYLGTMDQGWLNFTSNIDAAYGAGTNIGFREEVRNATGSRIIGGTVFGTV